VCVCVCVRARHSRMDLSEIRVELEEFQFRKHKKFAGSIPDGVTGIFQSLNPSGRIVALGSTQPLTEMSTRNPSCG
jgi:hypothetical protein